MDAVDLSLAELVNKDSVTLICVKVSALQREMSLQAHQVSFQQGFLCVCLRACVCGRGGLR